MSGHSKWSTIKHKKAITDARRSKNFSKLTHAIIVAAKEGGPNPETNFKLRLAIQSAKSQNLPNENIDRAIKKIAEKGSADTFEELKLELIGPENSHLIVHALTDNKNRTLSALKSTIETMPAGRQEAGFKIGSAGAVSWNFDQKGLIKIRLDKDKEEIELAAIDAGAEDIKSEDDKLIIISSVSDLEKIKNALSKFDENITAEITYVAKNQIKVSEETKKKIEDLENQLSDIEEFSEMISNVI